MNGFWKTLLKTIPLSIGIIASLISITYCVECYNSLEDYLGIILLFGIIGFPLVFGSVALLFPHKQ